MGATIELYLSAKQPNVDIAIVHFRPLVPRDRYTVDNRAVARSLIEQKSTFPQIILVISRPQKVVRIERR